MGSSPSIHGGEAGCCNPGIKVDSTRIEVDTQVVCKEFLILVPSPYVPCSSQMRRGCRNPLFLPRPFFNATTYCPWLLGRSTIQGLVRSLHTACNTHYRDALSVKKLACVKHPVI